MTSQPVTVGVAIGGVVATSVALAAVLWPDRLTPELQAAIIAFANALVVAATVVWTQARTTPVAAPRLPEGAEVQVLDSAGSATGDRVIVERTPPGPTGIDG